MGQSRWPSLVRPRSQPPRSRAILCHAAIEGRLCVRESADRETGSSVVEHRLQHNDMSPCAQFMCPYVNNIYDTCLCFSNDPILNLGFPKALLYIDFSDT